MCSFIANNYFTSTDKDICLGVYRKKRNAVYTLLSSVKMIMQT